jgi:hypothetical protein
MRLFKIDLPLANVLMGDYSTKSGEEYRKADNLLSRFAGSL